MLLSTEQGVSAEKPQVQAENFVSAKTASDIANVHSCETERGQTLDAEHQGSLFTESLLEFCRTADCC